MGEDDESYECDRCGDVVEEDELDADGVCDGCREGAEYHRQLNADYRSPSR